MMVRPCLFPVFAQGLGQTLVVAQQWGVFVCADDFVNYYGLKNSIEGPTAFHGVFDGHGGKHAADFACHHLPRFIAEDGDLHGEIERAISSAFMQTDTAFAEACTLMILPLVQLL